MTKTTADLTVHELLEGRELKGPEGATFNFQMEVTAANGKEKLDTEAENLKTSFRQNLKYWNDQTQILANNDFNNPYFKSIVKMGIEAVPFILEEIKKRPSYLVFALDQILPGVVNYGKGYIPLEKVCQTWISILSPTDSN